jgi:hypothetical protein
MQVTKKTIYEVEDFNLQFEPIEDSISIKETEKGFEVRYLAPDNDPINPREDENYSTMICFHSRYNLGDKHNYKDYLDFLYALVQEVGINEKQIDKYETNNKDVGIQLFEAIKKRLICILPLYLYDHSGISMRTFKFGHYKDWDCGQVGFIYLTKENLKKWGIKKSQVEKALIQEVEIYSQYLEGDCYCMVKETFNHNKEQIDYDIVGNYFGRDYAEEALKTDI